MARAKKAVEATGRVILVLTGDRHFDLLPQFSGNKQAAQSAVLATARSVYDWLGLDTKATRYVIQGEAKGLDTTGKWAFLDQGAKVIGMPAAWKVHSKGAGPVRNKDMLNLAANLADPGDFVFVLAFQAPDSKGTANMVRQARELNVPVLVHEIPTPPRPTPRTYRAFG